MSGTTNINDRNFWSDENIESIGEPATYRDWAPGPNENPNAVTRQRPPGDTSTTINYAEVENVEIIN